ncbi:MAG: MarR family winged helix-turn-helix transcriptional regulator [Candidatus Limivicinus sp.]|nr:MarR family winged helix-turn-helix transcriptional regulator [Clostridiales bacterium]MDY6132709.1 MarR family winged helix-turn-helix transcriptional regulator [Candidatus Limivicinus sp.]
MKNNLPLSPETAWLREYRLLIHRIIFLCNASATRFAIPQYYETEYKLTGTQFQIIEYALEGRNDKMSVISDRLGITRGAFSNNVKKLEELGLLYKEHRENNKKDYFLVVTEKGVEEYKKYAACIYDHCLKYVFAVADKIPKKYIREFEDMLEIYAEHLV